MKPSRFDMKLLRAGLPKRLPEDLAHRLKTTVDGPPHASPACCDKEGLQPWQATKLEFLGDHEWGNNVKTLKLAPAPALFGALVLAAILYGQAKADSVGLYVSDCSGGGYSYYTSSPAAIGTYELNGSSGCTRNTARSWLHTGTWQNWGFVQSSSDQSWDDYGASAARGKHEIVKNFSSSGVGNTCSAGAGNCGTW